MGDFFRPTPTNPIVQSTAEHQEQIRHRAHELYEERGRQSGHDLHDWLQAEAELTEIGMRSQSSLMRKSLSTRAVGEGRT